MFVLLLVLDLLFIILFKNTHKVSPVANIYHKYMQILFILSKNTIVFPKIFT